MSELRCLYLPQLRIRKITPETEDGMKRFETAAYHLHSTKIKHKDGKMRFAFLSDLHGVLHGENNVRLLEAIDAGKPDAILVTGDMYVYRSFVSVMDAYHFLKKLAQKYPVFYSPGNHEQKMAEDQEGSRYVRAYERNLEQAGVYFLHNESFLFETGQEKAQIWGLELPLRFYRKPFSPVLRQEQLNRLLPSGQEDDVKILLAHNPAYAGNYFAWGADLILSGHYHGGVVQLPGGRGLISPQFRPFAPYSHGQIRRDGQSMIVSPGLGEHTVRVRIHNPRQLIFITISR